MCRFPALVLVAALTSVAAPRQAPTRAVANDNRVPGGQLIGDTLHLSLTLTPVAWHIYSEREPAFELLAFAEEGKQPSIPGPLVRVRVGTTVKVRLRNPLTDTLVVRGFAEQNAPRSVLPGTTAELSFVARTPGTHMYWATANVRRPDGSIRRQYDSQLGGAIVIDPLGEVPEDRVLVITAYADRDGAPNEPGTRDRHGIPFRQFNAVNGKAWPHTERFTHAVGDSVRWRIVNISPEAHPMHLHGFYFRVDSHGAARAESDSIYTAEQRRMVVTETVGVRETVAITWSPDRPGGWLFHCHLTNHAAKLPPIGRRDLLEYPTAHHDGDPDNHAMTGMNGLIVGITVTGRSSEVTSVAPRRRLRLFVQSDSAAEGGRRFGYVIQNGAEPKRDSIEFPGPLLLLTRGEPTSIEVLNRTNEPTVVHWHGIEVESYFDGVPGWSGTPGARTTPAVRAGRSFDVRLTPKRAGTFMYHTHMDELRQQHGGLVGPLIVLEPNEKYDPARDFVFLISDGVPGRTFVNGSFTPSPKELEVGTTYRIRIADISVFRGAMDVRLMRDSALLSWRPIAKDGFTLPASQATMRPSVANVPSGETADFEFTPDRAGELQLEIGASPVNVTTIVRLRVLAKR